MYAIIGVKHFHIFNFKILIFSILNITNTFSDENVKIDSILLIKMITKEISKLH